MFLFLLLDWWPLARWAPTPRRWTAGLLPPLRLWREKAPLFALSAVLAIVTFFAQDSGGSVSTALPLRYRIARVEGKGIDVAFTDGTRKELPAFSATGAHFLARDVTGPAFGKMPFEFGARWGKDATIRGKGWAVPTPLALDAEVRVQGFDLGSAGPYVNEEAQVVVAGGRLDATLAATLQTRNDKLGGAFRGSLAIRSLVM